MNDYEQRKQERIDRYRERAAKANARSDGRFASAHDAIEGIPPGQPILIGHHSEKRHRAALAKHDKAMGAAFDEKGKAEYWNRKADAAESSHAISSADPEAVAKLREKLADLQADRETIKAFNARVRKLKADKDDRQGIHDALSGDFPGKTRELLQLLALTPYSVVRNDRVTGLPGYALSNLGANIKRVEKRIREVEEQHATTARDDYTAGDIRVSDNQDRNRIELYFTKGRPSDARLNVVRSAYPSWQWCRGSKCWKLRRKRDDYGWRVACELADTLAEQQEGKVGR